MSCWHPCSACLTTTTLVGPFTIASACRLWTLGGRNPLACEMDEKQARDERSVLDPSLAVAVTQCVWHHTRPGIPVPTVTKSKNENKQSRITTNHILLSSNTASLLHPSVPFPNAASSASSIVRTKQNCISRRTSSATSCSTSFLLAHGRMTLRICARWAPRTFIRIPPTGVTRPRSVI